MDDLRAHPVRFRLNGRDVQTTPLRGERLSAVLRERLGARDVKIGCNAGDCGACTVLVDGQPVCACLTPTAQAAGRKVETLTGLLPQAEALKQSFLAHGAAQCGICTPGMMVAAVALLRQVPQPTEAQAMDALGGVLCRCTGYRKIIDAVVNAHWHHPDYEGAGEVGASVPRVDGLAKVTGAERFGDDFAPPGTLVVHVIRAPHHHAAFAFGDLEAFAADNGLAAVLTAADVPGVNRFGVIPGFEDQPVFAEGVARFKGEAVAAIVGAPDRIGTFSDADFPVRWTPLPEALGIAEAMTDAAPLVHPDRAGNIMCGGHVRRGDVAAGLAQAAATVEGRFTTSFVEHAYIEPEAGYACLEDGRVVIHACTQAPVMDREAMARILGRPEADVRIVPTAVGGGFGSKLDISLQPYVALAALKTGKPVRITYSRVASMQSTTKRHPADMAVRIGADADGTLTAIEFIGDFNTGAYASWGPTVANRVPVHASGPYSVPNYLARTRAVHTHCAPSGAFRGFGVPQAVVAQEQLFDQLADRLGIDPLEFRIRNALKNGQPTVCGQVFDKGVGIGACFDALRAPWDAAKAECDAFNARAVADGSPLRRGAGIAAGWYGCGNTSLPNPSTIKAGITRDGRLFLHQGAMDIGQGANTVIAQIFAEALGVPLSAVTLVGPDTDVTPDAGKTSASRQTFVSGNAARLCGLALRAQILRQVNAGDTARIELGDGLRVTDGAATQHIATERMVPDSEAYVLKAVETYDPPTRPLDKDGQGVPYAQFGYAAHIAVVEVDTGLGTVKPLRFVAAHDVGRAINPGLVEGQVQGGIAQGLGMALMEEFLPGRTENLHDYLIPTIGDMPPVETLIVEEEDAHGPYGAKGLGEHVLIPTAPAILNAIARATGVRPTHLPVTPARLKAALKGR